jgi:hypothetical protein
MEGMESRLDKGVRGKAVGFYIKGVLVVLFLLVASMNLAAQDVRDFKLLNSDTKKNTKEETVPFSKAEYKMQRALENAQTPGEKFDVISEYNFTLMKAAGESFQNSFYHQIGAGACIFAGSLIYGYAIMREPKLDVVAYILYGLGLVLDIISITEYADGMNKMTLVKISF